MGEFHFLRPYWLLLLIPLFGLFWALLKRKPGIQAWSQVCDVHLLKALMIDNNTHKRFLSLLLLLLSALCMLGALAGPTWSKNTVPIFREVYPRVLVLDLSNNMLTNDLSPSRVSRAKYKIRDLFKMETGGLYGLVVFTSEPFVVSPLTEDAKTIESLVPSLSPEMMPVQGYNLSQGIQEAAKL